jgi:hypothetical protein
MATKFTFKNQVVKLPGSYSNFVSGVTNPPLALSYGNVLLIDNGLGGDYGAGAGATGTLSSGPDSIYQAETLKEFRDAVGGGIFWDIAEKLFQPNGPGGGNGVSKLFYARAATTVAAEETLTFTGGGANGGTAVIQAKNEGTVGNGVEVTNVLTRGYAITMVAGVNDPNKFIFKFWRGTYRGVDGNGYLYDGVAEADTKPVLIVQSPEVDNIADFHSWMEKDTKFGSSFKLKTKTVAGDGSIDSGDLAALAGNNLFAAGTTTYNTSQLDIILENVQSLDYSLVLADGYGDNAQSADNGKMLAHLADGDTFGDKLMVVGGGHDSSKFADGTVNSSIETAQYYNQDRVIVCHGAPIKLNAKVADGFIEQTSLHKAATICGRLAGLEPQIPITFKPVRLDGEVHKLSIKEQKQGLDNGVLMTVNDGGLLTVLQGVNSIQENDFLINADASTHSIQLRRMIAQVNRELVVNATNRLLRNPIGTNRNTLSIQDVISFTTTYLKGRTATATQDNLIISFRNVNAVLDNDAYKVTYDVIFNTEITKMFFTGTVFLNF